jgi:hypothetical protein
MCAFSFRPWKECSFVEMYQVWCWQAAETAGFSNPKLLKEMGPEPIDPEGIRTLV